MVRARLHNRLAASEDGVSGTTRVKYRLELEL